MIRTLGIITKAHNNFIANNTRGAITTRMVEYRDTWTQKADFGGVGRNYAVGFGIGGKGYLGTGVRGASVKKDFWEYSSSKDTWTQKADFGGGLRVTAVGFSIGGKGYIGTGSDTGFTSGDKKDFWEYNPNNNTWTQKADFGGNRRHWAVGFAIQTKGYIGTGWDAVSGDRADDFWEYTPSINSWAQRADFGGGAVYEATGFAIADKGYIGTGNVPPGVGTRIFWEYNSNTNIWTQKADFAILGTSRAVGFNIATKGYIASGSTEPDGFWEYNPNNNTWTQKADLDRNRYSATGFSIGTKGYIGTGEDDDDFTKDFYSWG